jgi:hypothetical protein
MRSLLLTLQLPWLGQDSYDVLYHSNTSARLGIEIQPISFLLLS